MLFVLCVMCISFEPAFRLYFFLLVTKKRVRKNRKNCGNRRGRAFLYHIKTYMMFWVEKNMQIYFTKSGNAFRNIFFSYFLLLILYVYYEVNCKSRICLAYIPFRYTWDISRKYIQCFSSKGETFLQIPRSYFVK